MENDSTDADSEISTIVSEETYTLVITDITTVPSASTVKTSPTSDQVTSGSTASYTLVSRSADGSAQAVTTDAYTVTLTCNTASRCGDESYSYTSSAAATDGEYTVDVSPTLGGIYDVVITMKNSATDADQNIDTIVNDSLTLTVIDTTTVPSFCTVVTAPSTGEIVRPTGSTFSFTMQSKSSDGLD